MLALLASMAVALRRSPMGGVVQQGGGGEGEGQGWNAGVGGVTGEAIRADVAHEVGALGNGGAAQTAGKETPSTAELAAAKMEAADNPINNPHRHDPTRTRTEINLRLRSLGSGSFVPAVHPRTGAPWLHWVPTSNSTRDIYEEFGSNDGIRRCFRDKQLLLVGTSYQRIMWHDLLRALGLPISVRTKMVAHNALVFSNDANCSAAPPPGPGNWAVHEARGEGDPALDRACYWVQNETVCQYEVGLPGFDVASCGLPMTREERVVETNTLVRFHMKTYLRTPIVDALVRKSVWERPWDLIITSGGEWSRNGPRSGQFFPPAANASHSTLATEFLRDVLTPFGADAAAKGPVLSAPSAAGAPKLWLHRCQAHGFKESTRQLCGVAEHLGAAALHDKYIFGALRAHDRSFRRTHGFEGPYTDASARVFAAAVCAPWSWTPAPQR